MVAQRQTSSAAASRHAPLPADHISPANFERLAKHINSHTGIMLPPSKTIMMEGRLRRRVRELGMASIEEYCQWLFSTGSLNEETPHLINLATTNKTDFFREPNHFDYLAGTVLPEILARGQGTVRAWSSACSTGAEPYTMAMVLDDFALRNGSPKYSILATDIDTDVLDTAQRGIFASSMIDPVPLPLRQRYVMDAKDPSRNESRIIPRLRSSISFARMNLMDSTYKVGEPMDIIFCRNVLIYFDKGNQARVVTRLVERLKPGGHLFLGHSEALPTPDLPVKQVSSTTYQKVRA
jgi:chemotaxis protein methyltransferase CheR